MGIDYTVNLACAVKRAHPGDELLRLSKLRTAADTIARLERRPGSDPAEKVVMLVNGPGGTTTRELGRGELAAEAAAFDRAVAGCRGCEVDRDAGGFGCHGYINYPLTEEAEHWLLSRLPDELDGPEMHLLTSAIRDFGYDGAEARAMRARGTTFFVARQAPRRSWGKRSWFGLGAPPLTITSDQIFHAMFQVGTIEPMHAALLCLFLGAAPLGAMVDRSMLAGTEVERPDDPVAAQLAVFLETLALAAARGLTIDIDA